MEAVLKAGCVTVNEVGEGSRERRPASITQPTSLRLHSIWPCLRKLGAPTIRTWLQLRAVHGDYAARTLSDLVPQ